MRKNIVAGNWKMNGSVESSKQLFTELNDNLPSTDVEVIVFPPFLYIQQLLSERTNDNVKIGVQNFYPKDCGAYTGEISVSQLKDIGVEYALVGHSERREYFNEDAQFLKDKVDALIANDIVPVFCCGEPLGVREAKSHVAYVSGQIEQSLFHLSSEDFSKVVIAYEPIWAIGTGVTASSEQAQDMHDAIRKLVGTKYGADSAENCSVLYGGSCKPSNAVELFSKQDVDGGLIGGAALDSTSFIDIVKAFN
jgi:triosephosphate isomerase